MKRLIIADTYFQLIIATQMRLSIFEDDEVDLWLSDHSSGSNKVLQRLSKLAIFNNVEYIFTKKSAYESNIFRKISDVIRTNVLCDSVRICKKYDEIIFYGIDMNLYKVMNYYNRIGHKCIWSRYEEGLLSYETDFEYGKSIVISRNIRKILRKGDFAGEIKNYYCFFPDMKINYADKWNMCKVPFISDEGAKLLAKVFDYKKGSYKQKYIFFASSSDIDGHSYGETDLILKIAECVGKENILVKVHPRDTRNVYSDYGIEEMKDNAVPWEIIQLNENFDGKILLTVDSGAFISVSAMRELNVKSFFLFELVNNNEKCFIERCQNIRMTVRRLHEINCGNNISIYKD